MKTLGTLGSNLQGFLLKCTSNPLSRANKPITEGMIRIENISEDDWDSVDSTGQSINVDGGIVFS